MRMRRRDRPRPAREARPGAALRHGDPAPDRVHRLDDRAGAFVLIFLRAAMSPERRAGSIGWVRAITGPNARYLFAVLAVAWAAGFGFLIPQFPNVAESAYGALALIALFSGFFIMMGLLWSVIGE
jgi:hypothetical protein